MTQLTLQYGPIPFCCPPRTVLRHQHPSPASIRHRCISMFRRQRLPRCRCRVQMIRHRLPRHEPVELSYQSVHSQPLTSCNGLGHLQRHLVTQSRTLATRKPCGWWWTWCVRERKPTKPMAAGRDPCRRLSGCTLTTMMNQRRVASTAAIGVAAGAR